MHELWARASYEPHLLSLPFALAPAALLTVIAYAAVMRGPPALRGFLVCHSAALLPYATAMMLSPSLTSPALAEQLFRVAASFIPMAGATGTAFQIALVGRYRRQRPVVWIAIASAAVWLYAGNRSDALIDGVQRMSGYWYAHAGPWVWLALVHTVVIVVPGARALGYAALAPGAFTPRRSSEELRQLRAALVASAVTYGGLIDIPLAYGVGAVPLGWLLSGIGCLLVVRALIVEDLLRVRAVDTSAPLMVVYFAVGALLAWAALSALPETMPWPLTALAVVMCCASVRVSVAAVTLVKRGGRAEDALDRLLAQLVGRARAMAAPTEIAQLTVDVVELGIGREARVLLASTDDWGWLTQTGERLDDASAPDPLMASWLADRREPVFADDLEGVPRELRPLARKLFAGHRARAVIPVASADELLGLIVIPSTARRVRGAALAFLPRAAERLAEALLHARLMRQAAERAELAREVELAATVQAELLPGLSPHRFGALTVVGAWQPATRCAGDFWTVIPLGERSEPISGSDGSAAARLNAGPPVLIAIGDVSGHGVASAMVTAAAIGACDVCARRDGATLNLVELLGALDGAVRRVGGGELTMTCFAAIIDPAARELRFVSSGHPAPYLCRATERAMELHALVGRGNPLGSGGSGRAASGLTPLARVQHRPLQAGDLVVWYTDGVVEAQDPAGTPFGDRRLQHLLKKLDRARQSPLAVRDLVQSGVAAHRAGRPAADDQTLVVAQLEAPA